MWLYAGSGMPPYMQWPKLRIYVYTYVCKWLLQDLWNRIPVPYAYHQMYFCNSVSCADFKITMYVIMCMCMCCGNHVINVHENKVQCTLD